MLDRSRIENKAIVPQVFGPGGYICPDCKLITQLMGSTPVLLCPDCKKPMKPDNRESR